MDDQHLRGEPPAGAGEPLYGSPTPPGGVAEPTLVPLGEAEAPPTVGLTTVDRRPRRLRWTVAIGLALAVVLVAAGAFWFIAGAAGTSLTAGYAPKTSLALATLRVDLPGDQNQKLADLASHFPGFSDRSAFGTKLDEAMNDWLKTATSGELTYTSDMKTWMTGEVSVALTKYPDVGAAIGDVAGCLPEGVNAAQPSIPAGCLEAASKIDSGVVAIVGLKDKAKADAFVTDELKKHRITTTSETYAGETLNVSADKTVAYALLDKVLLVGTPDGVKASLDTKTKGSIDQTSGYQAARKALPGDQLAWFYVDYAAILSGQSAAQDASTKALASLFPSGFDMPTLDPALGTFAEKLAPPWVAGALRAESDHLAVDFASPRPKAATTLKNGTSDLAASLPASTLAVIEVHSIGSIVDGELKLLSAADAPKAVRDAVKQLQDAAQKIGGLESLIGWMGDGAFALTATNGQPGGGLVVEAPDAKTAADKVAMIRTGLSLLGLGGSQVQVSETTYKDSTILEIKAGGTAAGATSPEIAITSHGNLVVAGYGLDFVKAVIDASGNDSLAGQSRYQAAMNAAGSSNAAYFYVDVQAAVELATKLSPQVIGTTLPDSRSQLSMAMVKAIDSVAGATVDGDVQVSHLVIMAH